MIIILIIVTRFMIMHKDSTTRDLKSERHALYTLCSNITLANNLLNKEIFSH